MDIPISILNIVAKQLSKKRVVELKAEDIQVHDFIEFVEDYVSTYSYLPTSWQSHYQKVKTL